MNKIVKILIPICVVILLAVIFILYFMFFRVKRLPSIEYSFLFYKTSEDIGSGLRNFPKEEALDLSFIVPSKKIFHEDERIQVYAVSLTHPNKKAKLNVIEDETIIYEKDILFDRYGICLFDLPNLDRGFYGLSFDIDYELAAENYFWVVERSSPYFSAMILNKYWFKDLLTIWGVIQYKGIAYQGSLKAEILLPWGCSSLSWSEIDKSIVLSTIDLKVVNGYFIIKCVVNEGFYPYMDSFPLFLRIYYDENEKCVATFFLPKREFCISTMGDKYSASLGFNPLGKRFYGLSLTREKEITESPWKLDYPAGKEIKIRSLIPLEVAVIYLLNPVTLKVRRFILKEPKSFSVSPDDPYSLLSVYSNSKSSEYFDQAFVFKDKKQKANINLRGKFKAGEDLQVEIKTSRPSKCVLIISNGHAERESLYNLWGFKILKYNQESVAFSHTCKIPERYFFLWFSVPPPPPPSSYHLFKNICSGYSNNKNILPLSEPDKSKKALGIVLFDSFEVNRRITKKVKMPDAPGLWKVELLAFYENQYSFDNIEKIFETH